jgi:predicted nucleotide-binding protein
MVPKDLQEVVNNMYNNLKIFVGHSHDGAAQL